jgi:O-antigen/teichoic acid export membrane protein
MRSESGGPAQPLPAGRPGLPAGVLARALRPVRLPPRVAMLLAFAATSLTNYAFGLATGWLLLPGDFGLLAFAQTILLIGGLVLNSGFALAHAAAIVGQPPAERAARVRGALAANVLIALAFAAMLVALFALGPLRPGLEQWPVTLLVAAALPLIAFAAIGRATAQGTERFGTFATMQVLEIVAKALAGVALILAGFGAAGAVAGFVAGGLLATVPALVLFARLGVAPWGPRQRPPLGAAGAMFAALLGLALLLNLDLLALKLLSTADRQIVGYYQAGIVLANAPYYLASAMLTVAFTELVRVRRLADSGPLVADALRLVLVFIVPLEVALAVAPQAALRLLFPGAYAPGAEPLRILALGNTAVVLVAVLATAFQATGRARTPGRVLLAVVAIEALVLRAVVPPLGAVAAAATFLTAALVALAALAGAYTRALERPALGRALAWLARYALVLGLGTALGAGALQAGTGLPVALLLAGPLYLALVFAARLIDWPRAERRPAAPAAGESPAVPATPEE